VHWDSVTAKRPMELICSVSLIAKRSKILEDEDDDEHEDDSSNSEFRSSEVYPRTRDDAERTFRSANQHFARILTAALLS
jgi:hypothetical protein